MPLPVTALCAAVLGLISIVLAGIVGRARGRTGVSLGDGGKPELLEAMRRQGNFVEYVPLFLVLLAIVELNGAPKWWLYVLGAVMVASRIVHPFGIHHDRMNVAARIAGAAGTMIASAAVSLTALWQVVAR